MVQIKQKRGIGVESPSPRSFSGGMHKVMRINAQSHDRNDTNDTNNKQ